MKRRILHLPLTLCLYLGLCSSCTSESKDSIVEDNLTFAQSQLRVAFDEIDYARTNETPESRKEREKKIGGNLPIHVIPNRTVHYIWYRLKTGPVVFPGELWYLYEYTQNNFWKRKHNSIQICLNGKR